MKKFFWINRKCSRGILIFFIVCAFLCAVATKLHATTISPLRYSLGIDPGEQQTITVTVLNDSEKVRSYKPTASGFILDEDSGSPIFDQETDALKWISASPETMTLRPGEEGTFSFTVQVPPYTEPEVRYLGLFAEEEKVDGQIEVTPRVGTLLFLYIGGTYHEDVTKEEFSVDREWHFDKKISLTIRLKNNGNIHAVPQGKIVIENILGNTIAEFEINKDRRKIIPQQEWSENIQSELHGIQAIGPIRARLELEYGLSKQMIHANTTWWILPWQILLITSASFILIIILSMLVFKRLHRQKKK